MYRSERNRFLNEAKNPSFSSTLLDKIYRSIDEGERKSGDMKFYRETTTTTTMKKQSRSNVKCNRAVDDEEVAAASLQRARLLEKRMDRKTNEKVGTQGKQRISQIHHDQDVLFFSSSSTSSDSSSGGLSSSDTDSMYGMRSRASCFAPHRPKPVRTSVCEKSEKTLTEKRQSALFHEQKGVRRQSTLFHEQKGVQMFDNYSHNSNTRSIGSNEEGLIKSKSRAMKIYNNLKKVKQPLSPGGKLSNFLNSLFTTGNTEKIKTTPNVERKANSGQASTCSSSASFSRSCLSKTSPSTREKLRNGVKRTVQFYPVSVIVDEDSRPCGHKCLYEEEDRSLVPMSVPKAWKIGVKKNEEELKSMGVEEAARDFLKKYHHNKKNDLVLRNFPMSINEDEDEDEDDDAASCSSSDLFELDHLTIMANDRYCEELPVYETTHFRTNRAIANGLI